MRGNQTSSDGIQHVDSYDGPLFGLEYIEIRMPALYRGGGAE
jgi:hypothetical protein